MSDRTWKNLGQVLDNRPILFTFCAQDCKPSTKGQYSLLGYEHTANWKTAISCSKLRPTISNELFFIVPIENYQKMLIPNQYTTKI